MVLKKMSMIGCVGYTPLSMFLYNNLKSDCFLMTSEQYFSYIMARTSYISMRWWWCPLCTRQTRL